MSFPQCGQITFSGFCFCNSAAKPEAMIPAGRANKPIPITAMNKPINLPSSVMGYMSSLAIEVKVAAPHHMHPKCFRTTPVVLLAQWNTLHSNIENTPRTFIGVSLVDDFEYCPFDFTHITPG
jgi:hypothetical protein